MATDRPIDDTCIDGASLFELNLIDVEDSDAALHLDSYRRPYCGRTQPYCTSDVYSKCTIFHYENRTYSVERKQRPNEASLWFELQVVANDAYSLSPELHLFSGLRSNTH